MNKCSTCKNDFIPSLKPAGEPYKCCDKCNEQKKEYRKANADKIKANADKAKEQRKEYNKEYYKANIDKVKEYNKVNADKRKEYNKEYRKANADKAKEYKKEYNKEYNKVNADKKKEYKKEYYKANINKAKEYNKEYSKERFQKVKNNLSLYLVHLQRRQLHRCLKSSILDKSKHSIEYLGCNIETFINHIQKKIDNFNEKNEIKMNWSNIHLDHIKPVSRFNLDDENEFLDCCHYTNFQPLLIKDNLEKYNKWTDDNNKFWNENIKGKEYLEIYI